MAKVKADLDRDVVLGGLEKVLENKSVMWQSRMHMVPNTDRSCMWNVDLWPMNDPSQHI